MISSDTTPTLDTTFDLKAEIKKLEESTRRDLEIIGFFLKERKVDLRNKEQLKVAIARHLRPANLLTPFEDDQIVRGFKVAKDMLPDAWTMETVVKILCK